MTSPQCHDTLSIIGPCFGNIDSAPSFVMIKFASMKNCIVFLSFTIFLNVIAWDPFVTLPESFHLINKDTKTYLVCQQDKPDRQKPARLLHPLLVRVGYGKVFFLILLQYSYE